MFAPKMISLPSALPSRLIFLSAKFRVSHTCRALRLSPVLPTLAEPQPKFNYSSTYARGVG